MIQQACNQIGRLREAAVNIYGETPWPEAPPRWMMSRCVILLQSFSCNKMETGGNSLRKEKGDCGSEIRGEGRPVREGESQARATQEPLAAMCSG